MTVGSVRDEISWRWPLVLILAAGLALRIAWALAVPVEPVSDSLAYHTFATTIAEHGVYGWKPEEPSAYWAVGTPAIIGALYKIFGPGFGPVVVLNILVSVAVIWQAFLLARHWFGAGAGLAAAALIAFWPSLIMYVTVLASEVYFLFLVLGGTLAFFSQRQPVWTRIVLAGLFWAGATYVRPIALLLPVVFGFALLVRGAGLGTVVVRVVAVGVVMGVLIAPWTWRNYQVFGKPVLISTNFGANFWMGNNPETTGGYQPLPDWIEGMSETERAAALQKLAMEHIRAEPVAFLKRSAIKFVRLHQRETIAVHWNAPGIERTLGSGALTPLKLLATGYWYLVLVLAFAGLFSLARQSGVLGMLTHPATLYWGYVAALHSIIVAGDRYHLPAIPMIAILAAVPLSALAGRRFAKSGP